MKIEGRLREDEDGNPVATHMNLEAETEVEEQILSGLYVTWAQGGTIAISNPDGELLLKYRTEGAEDATFTPEEDFGEASEEDGEGQAIS